MRYQIGDRRGAAAVSLYSEIGRLNRPGWRALVQGDLWSRAFLSAMFPKSLATVAQCGFAANDVVVVRRSPFVVPCR